MNDGFLRTYKVVTEPNGNVYSGEWDQNGRKNGLGVLIKADGDIYEGEWRENMYNGLGRLVSMATTNEVTLYSGELKNGVENGQGEKIFRLREKDGQDVTKGNFLDGHLDGQGEEITDYGDHYNGAW
jgi:hypothetical protein